jgi:hypothetical protein
VAHPEVTLPRFCEVHADASLCSDFDEPVARPFTGWNRAPEQGIGKLDVDRSGLRSSPQSMISCMMKADAGDGEARLEVDLPKTAMRTRVSFDMRASEPPLVEGERISIGEIWCGTGGAWLFFRKNRGIVQLGVFVDGFSDFREVFGASTDWMRLEIDAAWAPQPHLIVRLNGAVAIDTPFPHDCRTSTPFSFVMGASGRIVPGASWEARYDNALVEIDPP